MQSIITQLAKNNELLSDLVQKGRANESVAAKHIVSGELLATSGVALELRAGGQLPCGFKVELSGVLGVEPA